ncbi:unnamed protein product [Allacma fusca]|uniref:Uncharacterized protein n=1 Tax=Allacma fusca TaxID=39272 RepID=A0A8J2PCW3_9HEXA|nr:unnamed protein product [Allacma fusca]
MPTVPAGWSICRGCEMVFIKDGQRFCGLCQYRTPAGTNYVRIHSLQIRRLMNLEEEMRIQLAPLAANAAPGNGAPQAEPAAVADDTRSSSKSKC